MVSKQRIVDQLDPDKVTGREQKLFDALRIELAQVAERHIELATTPLELAAITSACLYFAKCFSASELQDEVHEVIDSAKK
jgi:hypothetical protein